jgi:hypothetical protein
MFDLTVELNSRCGSTLLIAATEFFCAPDSIWKLTNGKNTECRLTKCNEQDCGRRHLRTALVTSLQISEND